MNYFKKNPLIVCLLFSSYLAFSQSKNNKNSFFSELNKIGESYNLKLRKGEVSDLKTRKPPKNTWTYESLLEYSEYLKKNNNNILFGSYIEPLNADGFFGYNFFAFETINKKVHYFFAAVITIDTNQEKFKVKETYLFTEADALKSWWMHTFQFYQSEKIKRVPKEFLYYTCPPPPPFKE